MDDFKALTIRLPAAVYEQIKWRSQLHRRKMGPEILMILEEYLDAKAAPDHALLTHGTSDPTGNG